MHCYICKRELGAHEQELHIAFFEGNIVDPEIAPEWEGFPTCPKCYDVIVVPSLKQLYYRGPTIEMFPETLYDNHKE